jgi:hypothetical protein
MVKKAWQSGPMDPRLFRSDKEDVMSQVEPSELRVEKARTAAILSLTNGTSIAGHFFVSRVSATSGGPERVAELLNSESGFFPYEISHGDDIRTVLYNRDHVVSVALPGDEARRDPGYSFAREQTVSVLLSNGRRLVGSVRVYRPYGRDRLSDWARHGERFRYLETDDSTFVVNVDQIVAVSEVADR